MTSAAPDAAAAIPAAPSSMLSPHATPYTLRARPVCAPPGSQQDGNVSRSIDDNSMMPSAYLWMKSCDTVYPASSHGMHQNQSHPSSLSGIHANIYPSSASSNSGCTWVASDSKQEQFPLTSGTGTTGNKSTKVTIKCPPDRTLGTNNISVGSKSKLVIRERDDCCNESGKDISCRNLQLSNHGNASGSSQDTMGLNPVLKPLHIPSARASSVVSVADDLNPDPSECSVDSPCWKGALASRVSSVNVLQTSDGQAVKQELVNNAGRGSIDQDCVASTVIEKLAASKSKKNHSQPSVEWGRSKQPEDVDRNMKNHSCGKEVEHGGHGAGKFNAEHTHCLEVRNNCMKRSGLNSSAPDFIPSSIRKSSSGNGLPSSGISQGSCSSTGRNTAEILKAIKSLTDVLQNSYYDGIELPEHDLSLLRSIIETLQSLIYKERKDPVEVASDKARLKAFRSEDALSKPVAINQNVMNTADNGKGIIISNMPGYRHSHNDFGRNSSTGYQPAPNHFGKELSLSYEDEHSQVLIFKKLWIDAERAKCALKYQLTQTRMAIDLESSMAHDGDGPRNPSLQLCDWATDPSSSAGLALTCPPMLKNHPGAGKSTNLIYLGDGSHSGNNNVVSRSKDYVLKNIQGEHFLSDLEETDIRHGLQLVPNKSHMGWNSSRSDGLSTHSYIAGRDDILPASCEYGLSDWEHVLKDEIA